MKGKYTKDMVTKPSITTDLRLSDEEINSIYLDMKNIRILDYPEKFNPKSSVNQTPFETYSIRIIADGREKNIYWQDEGMSKAKEAVQLRKLFNKIKEIIINKEEYKKLPQAEGAYQ